MEGATIVRYIIRLVHHRDTDLVARLDGVLEQPNLPNGLPDDLLLEYRTDNRLDFLATAPQTFRALKAAGYIETLDRPTVDANGYPEIHVQYARRHLNGHIRAFLTISSY